MSTATMTRNRIGMTADIDDGRSPSRRLEFEPSGKDAGADDWERFSQNVVKSAERWLTQESGGREAPAPRSEDPKTASSREITVAPGIVVSPGEFAERYGGLDLDRLRATMKPEIFNAFVRHIGAVTGREDLDVDLMSDIPG